jgi:predicted nucleic acid-binding protein
MKIAITDANIFIDLIHVGLIDELFGIEVDIHTTTNVVDELNTKQQQALLKFNKKALLTIHTQEVFNIPEEIKKNKKLSDSDKSVFSLALQLDAFILTGDGVIRQISGFQKIEVHGILWLFEQFVDKKLVSKKNAVQQLKSLLVYNTRLPTTECERRINEWK